MRGVVKRYNTRGRDPSRTDLTALLTPEEAYERAVEALIEAPWFEGIDTPDQARAHLDALREESARRKGGWVRAREKNAGTLAA